MDLKSVVWDSLFSAKDVIADVSNPVERSQSKLTVDSNDSLFENNTEGTRERCDDGEIPFAFPCGALHVGGRDDGLNSTDSALNVRKEEPLIDVDEEPPISPGPDGLSTTAQTAEPDVLYADVNFKTLSATRVRTDRDGLNSTYSMLNFRKKKPRIDEDEDPPISSGPSGLSTSAPTAAVELESKVKIGNRPYRLICLLCLVTSALIVTVASLSIYEQECLQYWIGNEGGCYFITTLKRSYDKAMQYCWDSDSKLLEINSAEEANFVNKAISEQDSSYWIGKCKDGKFASNVLYRMTGSDPECGVCTHDSERKPCDQVHTGFICEKSGYLFPDIYEMIKDLCRQPVGPT
ncbi:uncharacterized protein LOC132389193 [Hypanus sabinus]|uniref:uncharacterized protein LOC132389193 n=1 Tax=Hypanus sabinus TaxID=79690 RepID=UPI0028C49ADE|nr:uncharacterized protein LOC132389193 [Hypanus sabinus]